MGWHVIVDPDFFEHWRTRMLVDALGDDEMAPMYVMRLWAHCQSRRAIRFDSMPSAGIKALCRFKGDAVTLESALVEAGFITRDCDAIDILKWADHNAKLISNWKNGATGGRPKKTEEEPNDNPNGTQEEPGENQSETHSDPIGGEEIREDLKPTTPDGVVAASDAGKPAKPDCPHQEIIALYHEVLPMCPRIREPASAGFFMIDSRNQF